MTSLTVVIPCFNAKATLEHSVNSVLAQQVSPMTVVIVDDASTDGSFKLAQSLAERHANVHALAMEKNSGPGPARNLGARRFPGSYLAFLDSDDVYLPGALTSAIGFMEKNPRWDAVKFGFETDPPLELAQSHYDITYNSIPSNMVVRRYVFDILNGFPEDEIFRGKLAGEDVAFYEAVQRLFNLARAHDKMLRYSCPPGSHLFKLVEECPIGPDGQAQFPQTPERAELGRAVGRYIEAARDRLHLAARYWSQLGCPREGVE